MAAPNTMLDALVEAEDPEAVAAVDTLEPGANDVLVDELDGPNRIVLADPPETSPVDPVDPEEERI